MDEDMNVVMGENMGVMEDEVRSISMYIPKQFDMGKLMSLDKEERDVLVKFITNGSNMFREEIMTTLKSYDLIIDQREGRINNLLND